MKFSAAILFTLVALGPSVSAQNGDPEYERHVVPFFRKWCLNCHDKVTREGLLSLENLSSDVVSDDFETWRMIDEQLRFGEMPPKDSDQPPSSDRQRVLGWLRKKIEASQMPGAISLQKLLLPQFGNYVSHESLFGIRRDHVIPAPPRLWRIRPQIYASVMPRADGLANGLNVQDGPDFKDYAASYFLDEAAAAPLLSNAKKMADALIGPKSKEKGFVRLAEEGTENPVPEVNRAFQLVLGRQARVDEQERFAEFYLRADEKAGHEAAARILLTAVLMQPETLYRQELGEGEPDQFGRVRLSPAETGFALSYALSNRPLASIMAAAGDNKLQTRENIAAVVRQVLDNDEPVYPTHGFHYSFKNSPRILTFFQEFFHHEFVTEVFKDAPEGIGEHDPGRLAGDLNLTIMEILAADSNVLAELLTTNRYFVSARRYVDKRKGLTLANSAGERRSAYHTAFNLPIDWQWNADQQPVEFHPDERAGVLTHPAWLAAWSGNFENHPVQRGKWIRTHLLGGTVPDVPIGVDARVPEKEHTSFRERLRLATAASECWRCHRRMDPLGVAFERFDHYGRYQRIDSGQPVDATSRVDRTGVKTLDGREFENPADLMRFLAKSSHVEQVFIRHAFRFFLGRNETIGDANTLQDAHEAYRRSDGSFRAVVVSLLSSDSFLLRRKPEAVSSKK